MQSPLRYDNVEVADAFAALPPMKWQWLRCDPESQNLVLVPADDSRWPLTYLLLRQPSYMRFATTFSDVRFAFGMEVRQSLDYFERGQRRSQNSNSVAVFDGQRQNLILCEGISLYSFASLTRREVPKFKWPQFSDEGASEYVIPKNETMIETSTRFPALQGATLEFQAMEIGHSMWIFRVSLGGRFARLLFDYVCDADLPTAMHNVRLRMATEEDNRLLLNRLSLERRTQALKIWDIPEMSPAGSRVMIESDEGLYSVWAYGLTISWFDTPDINVKGWMQVERPLWEGGPALAEL